MAYTTIDDPNLYFHTDTYTGNGSGAREITDLPFSPDMSWFKNRDATDSHHIFDRVRGAKLHIKSDASNAEDQDDNSLYAWLTNGYYVASSDSVNADGEKIVVWNWLESATSGFDIVSYTGNATGRDISHSLSALPKMIFVKSRSAAEHWAVWHKHLTASKQMYLNLTNAEETSQFGSDPTTSVFSLGTNIMVNGNTETYVAYLWSEKQGFSKFGKYTGNNNADGPFIYTGFKPAFVMIKMFNAAKGWMIYDNKRFTSNPVNAYLTLNADANTAEAYGTVYPIDFLSNGFKLHTDTSEVNAANNYVYMAFAESPLVNSEGAPNNAE